MKNMVAVCVAMICAIPVMANAGFKIDPDKPTIIEAEDYSSQKSPDSHAWKKVKGERKDVPVHILAAPSNNTVYDLKKKNFEKRSPCVSYTLNFQKAGTYYVWVRGLGEAGGASVAIGYDGELLKSQFVGFFGPKYGWLGVFSDGDRIKLTVEKSGDHTLGLWMVEDGVRIDKIVVSSDPGYDPNDP